MTPAERTAAAMATLQAAGDDEWRTAFCHALGAARFLAEQGDGATLRVLEDAVQHVVDSPVEAVAS